MRAVMGRPTPLYSLAVLRIAMGCFVMWQAYNKGVRVFKGYVAGEFNFTYPFFEWVPEFPDFAVHLAVLWFVSGLVLALGALGRAGSVLAFLMTLWAYVIPAEFYLNHEYMELLFLFLMMFMPVHRCWSVSSFFSKAESTAPYIHLLTLKLQLEIILIYAGIVKLNSDWLHLQPLSNWLASEADGLAFGHFWLDARVIAVGAFGVIALHILGAPLMMFRKTRLPVFIAYSFFHVLNAQTFNIDIFPWMTIACSTLFFEPDWPVRVGRKLRLFKAGVLTAGLAQSRAFRISNLAILAMAAWLVLQVLLPSRHVLYPGWVDWNDAGTRFSWRMMLAQRTCPVFRVILSSPDQSVVVSPDMTALLLKPIWRSNLCVDGDLILQTVHQVRDIYVASGAVGRDVEARVHVLRSLNFRAPDVMVDPKVDLAREERKWLSHYTWLTDGEELPKLPAPFQRNDKTEPPSAIDSMIAAGLPMDASYVCSQELPPNRDRGQDIVCRKK